MMTSRGKPSGESVRNSLLGFLGGLVHSVTITMDPTPGLYSQRDKTYLVFILKMVLLSNQQHGNTSSILPGSPWTN